jgi:hypothetical protein
MKITIDELIENGGNWLDICAVLEISEYAINEGLLCSDEYIDITVDQLRKILR